MVADDDNLAVKAWSKSMSLEPKANATAYICTSYLPISQHTPTPCNTPRRNHQPKGSIMYSRSQTYPSLGPQEPIAPSPNRFPAQI